MVVFSPSLSIDNRHELYWLYPSDPREGPSKDTIVEGEIVLQLPGAKRVKQIDVELIGLQRMSIKGEWIKHTTLHRFNYGITPSLTEGGSCQAPGGWVKGPIRDAQEPMQKGATVYTAPGIRLHSDYV